MRGTIVCGVTDSDEGRVALVVAAELSERLGLRLVLAHVAEGITSSDASGVGSESWSGHGRADGCGAVSRAHSPASSRPRRRSRL